MTKTLRLQTGLSDGSNSPTDWVPFYTEEAEEKEESDKNKSFCEMMKAESKILKSSQMNEC